MIFITAYCESAQIANVEKNDMKNKNTVAFQSLFSTLPIAPDDLPWVFEEE